MIVSCRTSQKPCRLINASVKSQAMSPSERGPVDTVVYCLYYYKINSDYKIALLFEGDVRYHNMLSVLRGRQSQVPSHTAFT